MRLRESILLFAAVATPIPQLNSAATVLRAVIDGGKPICRVTPSEAKKLVLPLHARIDEATRALAEKMAKSANPGSELAGKAKSCALSCECGIYADALEILHEKLDDSGIHLWESLQEQARKQSPADTLRCAKAAKSFCGSPLLKSLRQDARAVR